MYIEAIKIVYILVAGAAVMAGIVGYFLYSMIRVQRNYLHLHESQNQARITAIEKERRLIAADLHDDIGPVLSGIMFKLAEISPASEHEQKLLKESIDHVDGIFSRVRQIASMLIPPSLEKKGPLYAIEEFSSIYTGDNSLRVDVSPLSCKGITGENALHLYRMLQEILHNCLRHARASRLTIAAEKRGRKLLIRTADDGIGFDHGSINSRAGVGLENLALRAQMIGARLEMLSSPGSGTRYTIELLLPE